MANKKTKNLTPIQQQYTQLATAHEPQRAIGKNCIRAFVSGGAICVLGEGVRQALITWGGFTTKTAGDPTVAILIALSVFLTALGVYDKIGQWAGAGSAVPVTGFANALASAAIEHRAEGVVLGIGGQMFRIAGPVIVFGTASAFAVGCVHLLVRTLFGGAV